jgi:4-hydroxyphenylacetate 3-monooxygenase
MRTGQQYLDALRDGRTVFLDGERVADVTTHPAFAGITATVAQLYEQAADPTTGCGTSPRRAAARPTRSS